MKPVPYCIPDALRLVLETACLVSEDPFIHTRVLVKVLADLVEENAFSGSAVELTFGCLDSAYRALGVKDPYAAMKESQRKTLSALEGWGREYIASAASPFDASLDLLLACSAEDAKTVEPAAIRQAMLGRLKTPIGRDDREGLRNALARASSLLYILGSAREVFFDRFFIEILARKVAVTIVVAEEPILDQATRAEIEAFHLSNIATIVDPGAPMLGISLERASSSFQDLFSRADIVLARGEYAYESLATSERDLFFLFEVTCPSIAQRLHLPVGDRALICQRT